MVPPLTRLHNFDLYWNDDIIIIVVQLAQPESVKQNAQQSEVYKEFVRGITGNDA